MIDKHTDNLDLEKVALKMIKVFGDKCRPDYVNYKGETALIWACHDRLEEVAIKIIEIYGDKCKPGQVKIMILYYYGHVLDN